MDLGDNSKIKRARATNWPTLMSKFVLDWYLQKKKAMPPKTKTKFKKMHHHYCTSLLNATSETTFIVDQVHRHFRHFKEVWNIVARYMNVSGSRFDKKHKILILPPSTLASLPPSGSFAESTMAALKPRLKKCKVITRTKTTPNPKPQAPMPHDGRKEDMVKSALAGIRDSPAKPIRGAPTSSDPNAPLWNMLKEIQLTLADRFSVGIYLCKPEFEVH
uniref:Myb/SANT-like domain-containing protein n=1 Tax=Oryza punctata TaxID=4537 RepID=A0A0E0KZ97_ORYPU